jgi:hypothetical protein
LLSARRDEQRCIAPPLKLTGKLGLALAAASRLLLLVRAAPRPRPRARAVPYKRARTCRGQRTSSRQRPRKKNPERFSRVWRQSPQDQGDGRTRRGKLPGLACHCRISRMRSARRALAPSAADLSPNVLGLPLTIVAVDGPPVREIMGQHPP